MVFVAVENLWALRSAAPADRAQHALRHRWMITFAFGLVHGFGFASALRELHLPRTGLAVSLVAFNLGVEAGQIAIVSIFLPFAYLLRRTFLYRSFVLVGGSSAIVVVAALWFVERAFDLKFLPIH